MEKKSFLEKDPMINVISKEEFEVRVQKVFHLLWETLSKSFGPYGAPTLIYNYPYSHVTKDGYTIMKNLSLNTVDNLLDQAIADMAADICGRLNYSVGDGTTSAVIATNSIYQNYMEVRDSLSRDFIMPRDIISSYNNIKEDVITEIKNRVKDIRSTDPDELYKNIYDIVYVSSNGDVEMTEYISELYKELGCPAISCELAADGITKKRLITGYKYGLSLLDKLYINSDGNIMHLPEADIIIFSTKITKEVYDSILKPLNAISHRNGRHLVVAAPLYDEIALMQTIKRDLTNEYQKTKDINMVLMNYRSTSVHARKLIEDFATLTNTIVIDGPLQRALLAELKAGKQITELINIDNRFDIPNLKIGFYDANNGCIALGSTSDKINEQLKENGLSSPTLSENAIRLGYFRDGDLGLKDSTIHTFFYDEDRYNVVLKDAEEDLEEKEKKYQKLGTFNLEVSLAQQRVYALRLKMGIIEVGADSELSQKMIKDSVDDAIKAAASAYNNGVVLGCNVTLIQAIKKVRADYLVKAGDNIEQLSLIKTLFAILIQGFRDVYGTVLNNAFENFDIPCDHQSVYAELPTEKFDKDVIDEIINEYQRNGYETITFFNLIIEYSLKTNQVFDVSRREFSDKIVNSSQTDEEILKATIDLIGLLIVGNQMVITQRGNF
jgi:chaperonin GroEL (HSP60 family)